MILEHLARSRRGVTLSHLVQKLQLPRSTAHALLLTFQRCDYVKRDEETGRYLLGFRLHSVANMALNGVGLRGNSATILYQLMQDTGLTVHLAVLDHDEAILIDRVEPPSAPRVATWVGKRMGLHCTALGKSLIACLPADEINSIVNRQGLIRHNENTITSIKKLHMACDRIQQLGYAIDDEEEEIGVRCIGAPVYNSSGQVLAAISISGSTMQLEDVSARATQVTRAACALAQHLDLSNSDRRSLHAS
ncbi:MAG: IclR family transcriptional regulator [Acidobacteria bacterium]|nr:IclR family transcriptional regulator [Acidobacteriota bacterium]